jgi:hypothetical protein
VMMLTMIKYIMRVVWSIRFMSLKGFCDTFLCLIHAVLLFHLLFASIQFVFVCFCNFVLIKVYSTLFVCFNEYHRD